MTAATSPTTPPDQPFFDNTAYGMGPDDSITDTTESAAVTHHQVVIGGQTIAYTATAGHLVAIDPSSSGPAAKFFYVAFTADGVDAATRPVTFFYNGGPGSSSVFLLLGSFAPRRIKTLMPSFTPPAPYTMEDNPDSLLDKSDLVFINPVGTGYSAAIAPKKNRDFWGVDQDAGSLKQFIKRYLSANDRWNSPKFLFGESYGTARSCVLAWALHEDGIDLNGVTLQSSILDYAQAGNPVGLLPTLAADAWYHKKISVTPAPPDLASFESDVIPFAEKPYAAALAAPRKADPATVKALSDDVGISPAVLTSWKLDVAASDSAGNYLFLVDLLQAEGLALGSYDGRVTGIDTGIAGSIDPNSGGNDPTMTAVSGVYTVMWNTYLQDELKFTSLSSFTDLNDQAFQNWDFGHIDPTGAQKGLDKKGNVILYTAGDLAATMALNPDLKVFSANGYYDSVTPFQQTVTDLANMPLANAAVRSNLTIKYYPSGHMVYLDGDSRTAMKADLSIYYGSAVSQFAAMARLRAAQPQFKDYYKLRDHKAVARGKGAWSVPDLCQAYSWPSGLTGGGVIAIVELGGGWVQSDMDAFFKSINQPAPQIVDVSVDGSTNNPGKSTGQNSDDDIEVALDIQIAAASYYVATGKPAVIRVYWAKRNLTNIATALRAAAADGCDTCSISWGADEAIWKQIGQGTGHDYLQEMEAAAQTATKAGTIVFASSGDNDSSDGGPNPVNVDAPSSCPHVIACGGTSKTRTSETVWNNNPGKSDGQGTGGGFSTTFPVQSWQAGAPSGPGRMVPDVAADADPNTGYNIVVHGNPEVVGGTSAVAPLYAGLFAAFGTKLGFVTPSLWLNHLCFTEITQGDNGFYRARVGPDPCTGLGSPIGDKISALLAKPATAEIALIEPPALPAPDWSGAIIYKFEEGSLVHTSRSTQPATSVHTARRSAEQHRLRKKQA
jgi:carboxypeptidase C (cathepsin A)